MKTIIIIIIVLLEVFFTSQKPIYLSSVFRHVARYPVNDIYDGNQTRLFHGNLTEIGLRQHYLLGSYQVEDYAWKAQLFNLTLKPRQVEVFTLTDTERCIESAYAHVLGMFNFNKGEAIDQNIDRKLLEPPFENLIPINLNSEESNEQYALQYALQYGFQPVPIRYGDHFFPNCDNIQQIFTRQGKTIEKALLQLEAQFFLFTQTMGMMFKLLLKQIQVLGLIVLYDTLLSDKYLGRVIPQRFTDLDLLKLQFIYGYIFVMLFEGEPARIFNEPFMNVMLENMQLAIQNKLGVKRISLYSVHDVNVVPLMLFLNLTSRDCLRRKFNNETIEGNCAVPIPFAINLLFELHKNENLSNQYRFYVKVRYNGDYLNLCQRQSLECEYYQFKQRCKQNLIDFNKECSIKKRAKNQFLSLQ